MNLPFYQRHSQFSRSVECAMGAFNSKKKNENLIFVATQDLVILRCCFAEGRKNVQRFITHVPSHSFLIKPFVWWSSCCRRRRGLLQFGSLFTKTVDPVSQSDPRFCQYFPILIRFVGFWFPVNPHFLPLLSSVSAQFLKLCTYRCIMGKITVVAR